MAITKEQKNEFMRHFGTEALKVLESWMKKVGEEIDQDRMPFGECGLIQIDMKATFSEVVDGDDDGVSRTPYFLRLDGKFFARGDLRAKIKEQQG